MSHGYATLLRTDHGRRRIGLDLFRCNPRARTRREQGEQEHRARASIVPQARGSYAAMHSSHRGASDVRSSLGKGEQKRCPDAWRASGLARWGIRAVRQPREGDACQARPFRPLNTTSPAWFHPPSLWMVPTLG